MLSREDVQLLWNVTNLCAEVRTESDLITILHGPMKTLLPHGCSAFGLCRPSTDTVVRVLNIDFPSGFVDRVAQTGSTMSSPVAALWKQQRRVIHFAPGASAHEGAHEDWLSLFRYHGLRSITAHGAVDEERDLSSYFAFGDMRRDLSERDRTLIGILVPHLHNAFLACAKSRPVPAHAGAGQTTPLSEREIEVLRWVQAGKTNYETGQILGISVFTVKNHLQRIFSKLNATNRAHAISKAAGVGLLHTGLGPGLSRAMHPE